MNADGPQNGLIGYGVQLSAEALALCPQGPGFHPSTKQKQNKTKPSPEHTCMPEKMVQKSAGTLLCIRGALFEIKGRISFFSIDHTHFLYPESS